MQNKYKNTIKRMILANDNLRDKIINNYEIDNETKKIISIELFFLAFTIFLDFFEEIEISEEWKKIIKEQDYYIDKVTGRLKIKFCLSDVKEKIYKDYFIDVNL